MDTCDVVFKVACATALMSSGRRNTWKALSSAFLFTDGRFMTFYWQYVLLTSALTESRCLFFARFSHSDPLSYSATCVFILPWIVVKERPGERSSTAALECLLGSGSAGTALAFWIIPVHTSSLCECTFDKLIYLYGDKPGKTDWMRHRWIEDELNEAHLAVGSFCKWEWWPCMIRGLTLAALEFTVVYIWNVHVYLYTDFNKAESNHHVHAFSLRPLATKPQL